MSNPTIYYNGRSIALPVQQSRLHVAPSTPRTVSTTVTGLVETIMTPRVDIHVRAEFEIIDSASLRAQLHNWFQWAARGGVWAIALDASRRVDTELRAKIAPGEKAIPVVDATGITTSRIYKLIHGPHFQLIYVDNAVGGGGVILSEDGLTEIAAEGGGLVLSEGSPSSGSADPRHIDAIDLPFGTWHTDEASGTIYNSIFRDQHYYFGVLRDVSEFPIQDLTAEELQYLPQTRFRLSLDFYETFSGTL